MIKYSNVPLLPAAKRLELINFPATKQYLKVALDGGTRPGDTLQILPLALAQPPNPRSITSHSVLRVHPSLTYQVGFFRGIQWGIHSQKIINGTAICFLRKYAFQIKNIKHTHYIYIYIYICVCINLLYSLGMCNYYM